MVVQINGKTRDVIEIDRDLDEKKVINMVTKEEKFKFWQKNIIKHIFIKNKLINLVIK